MKNKTGFLLFALINAQILFAAAEDPVELVEKEQILKMAAKILPNGPAPISAKKANQVLQIRNKSALL